MKRFILYTFIQFFTFMPIFSSAQVIEQDSLALVDIYDNLDGENWYFWTGFYLWHRNYWVDGWGGIEVNNHRVGSVDLGWAYLNGTIPSSMGET